jgi:hypothetical protein
MWQVYAQMANDILADRRREADAARRRHEATPKKAHPQPAGLVRRLVTRRQEG